MNSETTLITAAASGLGLHLAHEFARNGHPLVLIAPDDTPLPAVASEIRAAHGVAVQILPGELAEPETAERLFRTLHNAGMTIEILVNNAGPVAHGQWSEMPVEQALALVRRNLEGALRMTKLFLPPMLARGRGRVLTTAWEVNSEPGPLAAVEQAAGAFLLTWSEALATELADTPITVTALGRDARHADPFSKTREPAPEEVAKTGYAGLMKKELLVVPGGRDRALAAAPRYFPAGAQARWGERSAVPAIAATDLKTAFCP